MHPRMSLGWAPPPEWPLHLWARMLCHRGPEAEELVRHRRYGTGLIRTVPAARAGVPINGAVPHVCRECLRNMGPQGLNRLRREPGERSSAPSALDHVRGAWHTHLPPVMSCVGEMIHDKP